MSLPRANSLFGETEIVTFGLGILVNSQSHRS